MAGAEGYLIILKMKTVRRREVVTSSRAYTSLEEDVRLKNQCLSWAEKPGVCVAGSFMLSRSSGFLVFFFF